MATYEGRVAALQKADEMFVAMGKMLSNVPPGTEVDIAEVCGKCGIDIDDTALKTMRLPKSVPSYSFVPWYMWFPWQSVWTHYWVSIDPSGRLANTKLPELGITVPVA